jgi:hypothetical protein
MTEPCDAPWNTCSMNLYSPVQYRNVMVMSTAHGQRLYAG